MWIRLWLYFCKTQNLTEPHQISFKLKIKQYCSLIVHSSVIVFFNQGFQWPVVILVCEHVGFHCSVKNRNVISLDFALHEEWHRSHINDTSTMKVCSNSCFFIGMDHRHNTALLYSSLEKKTPMQQTCKPILPHVLCIFKKKKQKQKHSLQ